MEDLKDYLLITLLAIFYFVAVYFAVAALVPALALQCSLLAAGLAMIVYLVLVIVQREEEGMLMGLLVTTPIICIAAGVVWWILRLLGLWKVR